MVIHLQDASVTQQVSDVSAIESELKPTRSLNCRESLLPVADGTMVTPVGLQQLAAVTETDRWGDTGHFNQTPKKKHLTSDFL